MRTVIRLNPGPAPSAQALSWPVVLLAAERRAWRGGPLTGITDDSRAARPGCIFIAHRGWHADGHAYTAAAVAAGASLVVAEQPLACAAPLCVVPDGRAALSALADAWFGHPGRRLRLIGVTGTNGKTTTAHLIAGVLHAAGLRPCVIGTLGAQWDGQPLQALPWTTPPPLQLHGLLAEAVAAGADACVLEVSAQGLSQARVADCGFEVGALTNLSREHREYYASEADYVQAKAALFRRLRHAERPAHAVLNRAVPHLAAFRAACAVPVLEYGPGADIEALSARGRGLAGSDLQLRLPGCGEPVAVRLRLPGPHNVDNALCAAAVGCALQVPPARIAAGLQAVQEVPGRLQHICRGPVRVLVDYAHNPAGLRALLGLLRSATAGRLVVVMGARGNRDPGKRPLMGAVVAAFADRVVLTADRPAGEDAQAAAEPMRAAVADCGVPVVFCADRLRALEAALAGSRPGDCVVAVGKGPEPWEGDSETPGLDDVRALRQLLAQERSPARRAGARAAAPHQP